MRIGPFGTMELIVILVILLLVFGARRLPEVGSSLGKSIRTFKSALMGEDDKTDAEDQKENQSAGNTSDRNGPY